MTVDICCLVLTLLSANVSDLTQTARFTGKAGFEEANPIAAPLVNGSGAAGEIVSGVVALTTAYRLERWNNNWSRTVMLLWAVAHIRAVQRNMEYHPEAPIVIMAPVLAIRW